MPARQNCHLNLNLASMECSSRKLSMVKVNAGNACIHAKVNVCHSKLDILHAMFYIFMPTFMLQVNFNVYCIIICVVLLCLCEILACHVHFNTHCMTIDVLY